MEQAIKPSNDVITYNELAINPEIFLIFLKADDKIVGFIFKTEEGDFSIQTSSDENDVMNFDSLDDIIAFYSRKLNRKITIWYEKIEDRS